jgi:vancomycin resistance protein YoaR
VRLPVRRISPPTRTIRDERTARYTEVVAAHETRYSAFGDSATRAVNIEVAARALDGLTIAPDAELSFNEAVGERTFERGYLPATELDRGGRRVEGIGGGICQVAATLHAAAFFGGFDVLEHHPHTRNSSYIAPGLDAAVSWPSRDVRVRNPHPFPVRVRATAYQGNLRIELMGAERAPRVEWNTRVLARIHRGVEQETNANLPLGTEEVLDEGEDGSVLERTRTVYWPDGAVTDTATLRYPVVHRLVRAGPTAVRQ